MGQYINNDLNINEYIYIKVPKKYATLENEEKSLGGIDIVYRDLVRGGKTQSYNYLFIKVWDYFDGIVGTD